MPTKVVNVSAKGCVDKMRKWHLTFHDPNKGQRGKQRHDALGIVENAGGFIDQNKSQRDKRIKNASHQTVQDDFSPV